MKNLSFSHTAAFDKSQDGNTLTFTWIANNSGKVNIPIAKYKDTELTLNGKKLSCKDYSLSGIGTPTVTQKVGKKHIKNNLPYWCLVQTFTDWQRLHMVSSSRLCLAKEIKNDKKQYNNFRTGIAHPVFLFYKNLISC